MKILMNISNRNKASQKLEHPDLYMQKLMLKTSSYVKACTIMKLKYNITFYIEP